MVCNGLSLTLFGWRPRNFTPCLWLGLLGSCCNPEHWTVGLFYIYWKWSFQKKKKKKEERPRISSIIKARSSYKDEILNNNKIRALVVRYGKEINFKVGMFWKCFIVLINNYRVYALIKWVAFHLVFKSISIIWFLIVHMLKKEKKKKKSV
jgi:hypothetical protein